MESSLVRVMLAMYLAIWSPALCCCAIKSFLGRMTGVEIGDCQTAACCSQATLQPALEVQTSCCGQSRIISQADQVHQDDAEPVHDRNKCKCHENAADIARVENSGKAALASMTFELAPALLLPASVMTERNLCLRGDWRTPIHRAHPPPCTLLALRCLLII